MQIFSSTAIDFENSEDEVKENIRFHKNVIETVKVQPWSMAKKLRALRIAKSYIKKHEGELAQSKQAKDIFATYSNWFRNVSYFGSPSGRHEIRSKAFPGVFPSHRQRWSLD